LGEVGKIALKTGAGGFVARTVWYAITEIEDNNAQMEAEQRVVKASQSATTETAVAEVLDATKKTKRTNNEGKSHFYKC